MEITLIPSTKPRSTDPPELILSFNVLVAPPTNVTCRVNDTPVDVADLSRQVTSGEYLPSSTSSPVTNVTVTLRTRQAGNYQCTVSVFRASMTSTTNSLTDATTSPITVSGKMTITLSTNVKEEIKVSSNSDRHAYQCYHYENWAVHNATLLVCSGQQHTTCSRL